MNILKDIEERHNYWWNHLLENAPVPENFDKSVPAIEYNFTYTRSNIATAWSHKVLYRMHHMYWKSIHVEGGYDNIIAHEVCHCFAARLFNDEKHKNFWAYLVRVVCNFPKEQRCQPTSHCPGPVPEIVKLGKLLKLTKQLQETK